MKLCKRGSAQAVVRISRRWLKLLAAGECAGCRPHRAAVAEAPRSHTSGGSCDGGRSLFWVCTTMSKVLGAQLPIGWWALVLCSQWCLPEQAFAMPQGTPLGPRAWWGLGVIREVGTPGNRGAGTPSGPKLDPKRPEVCTVLYGQVGRGEGALPACSIVFHC